MPARRPPGRSLYRNLIVEDTGCAPEQAAAVEEMMRNEHPTLDGLTRQRFRSCARRAMAVCRELGTLPAVNVSPAAVPVV